MRFAVIGAGVSGLTASYVLQQRYDVTLFEASSNPGGHTRTVDVERNGAVHPVDMGFIVFNEKNYTGFISLLERLGVASRQSDMSFGVSCESSGLEYRASSLGSLFAQARNLLRPSIYRMVADVIRFKKSAKDLLAGEDGHDVSLAEFLRRGQFSKPFVENFLVPMGAAVWSTDPTRMGSFPARFLIQFFDNHRFLDAGPQDSWRTVEGGSRTYVDRIAEVLGSRLRLRTPVRAVRRREDYVEVVTTGASERFDHVMICTHSDQALRMLDPPTDAEADILGAIPYQRNDTALHTDRSVMPRAHRAWASWNVRLPATPSPAVSVTYHMNRLQGIEARDDFLVTLNQTAAIEPGRLIDRTEFHHPVYTLDALAAQRRRSEISGVGRTSFCGAYWGFGFHEDGVQSALSATRPFGVEL